MEQIGDRIKKVRLDSKLNQQLFADKLSVSRSFISRVENNKEIPSETLLKLISWSFSCSLKWLKDGTGNKYSPYKDSQIKYRHILTSDLLNDICSTNDYYIKMDFAQIIQNCAEILCNNQVMPHSKNYFSNRFKNLISSLNVLSRISPDISEDISDDIVSTIISDLKAHINDFLDEMEKCYFEDELDSLLEVYNQEE